MKCRRFSGLDSSQLFDLVVGLALVFLGLSSLVTGIRLNTLERRIEAVEKLKPVTKIEVVLCETDHKTEKAVWHDLAKRVGRGEIRVQETRTAVSSLQSVAGGGLPDPGAKRLDVEVVRK
jgi:hypothetical protein